MRISTIQLVVLVALSACGSNSVDAGSLSRDAGDTNDGGFNPGTGDTSDAGANASDAGGVRDAGETSDGGANTNDAGAAADAGDRGDGGANVGDAGATGDAGANVSGAGDAGDTGDGGTNASDGGSNTSDAGALGPDFVIEGFGASTRGGWQLGSDEVFVTTLNDNGPGSLREALNNPPGPRIVRFQVDGTIALASPILVPSNVTIDGRSHSITLTGKGLILAGSDDVIITHLAIVDVGPDSEDGLRIGDPLGASERVVIDHVTFRATGSNGDSANVDEAMSIVFGSRDITLQWLRFENWEKVLLVGNGDAPQSVDSAITVSFHHSYFKSTGRRHPQARYGIVDLWNCFFDDWHMYDWFYLAPYRESFGAQSQDFARVRVENSLFRRTPHGKDLLSQADEATRCESNGTLDGIGNVVTPDSTATLSFGSGCVGSTGFTRPYTITLDAADASLRTRLETLAGN